MEFVFGDHRIDIARRELRRRGELISLQPQVFDLLVYLVRSRDRVVSKDDLLQVVWGGRIVSESTLTSRINAARSAIEDSGAAQRLIRTIARKGFRFVGLVREEQEAAAPADPRSTAAEEPAPPSIEAKSAPRLSIIVLPFMNLSDDPEQEYFADGITDDLTTDLSRISGSFVIARSTAFTYKGKPIDVRRVGGELGVRYVLEGSVRQAGDQVQVNVQLIDAESGAHVWAERFETDRRNLAVAHHEITGRLARTLNLELVRDASRRIELERAIDPDAQDLLIRGWASYHRPRSLAQTQETQRAFERVLELDPHSTDARIGLARTLIGNMLESYESGSDRSLAEASVRPEQLLIEAMESDPNRSMARASMGVLRRVQNRLTEARVELETATALDPNDDFAHVQLGWTLLFLGQPAAGFAEGEKALRLSPRGPQTWGKYFELGWCQLLLNQADLALDLLTRSRAANPRQWATYFGLAAALGLKGDIEAAKTTVAELLKLKPEVDSLARFRAYRPWGNSDYWELFEKTAAAGLRRAGFPDAALEADRVLATVLFTDIVGSTRRASEIGDRAWRVLLNQHDDAVRQELARFRGREVKTLGDGFLATFDGPARAVRCAAAIIDRVQPLGIAVRAGLHTGEVEFTGEEIGGIAVNIAARIVELAGGGEILVSGTVRDLVAGSGLNFDDRSTHMLKGLPEPLQLFAATG